MKPHILTTWLSKCRESRKSALIVFMILRLLIVACLFRQLAHGNYAPILFTSLLVIVTETVNLLF